MRVFQIITTLGLTLFISCNQCEDCEFNGNTERLCEQDFDTPEEFRAAVNAQEAGGAECIAVF